MMHADLSKEHLESLEYRRERLGAQMDRLEQLVSGSGEKLLPLVRTPSGAHSESGTRALIEDLLYALETAGQHALSRKDRALFSSFLYCAIRIAEEDPWWLVDVSGKFQDILRLGESLRPSHKAELCYMEMYRSPELDGFFGCMDELFFLFSGTRIKDTFPEEERGQIRNLHSEESAELEEMRREIVENQAFPDGDGLEACFPDEDDYEQEEREAQRKWAAGFAEKEKFCGEYLKFRSLYFDEEGSRFPDRLRQMLEIYFAERGASLYLNDDAFFEAYAQLNEIARRLQAVRNGRSGTDGAQG